MYKNIRTKDRISWVPAVIIAGFFYSCILPAAYALKPQFDIREYAEEECLNELSRKEVSKRVSTFEIGEETSFIKYREPNVMREKGVMYGVVASYAYHKNIMLEVEGRGSWGMVDYRNSGAINNVKDCLLEFRALGGYDFTVLERYTLTPYLGFGYRFLNDDLDKKISSTGAWGYERESNYYYSPLGVEVAASLGDKWSIGVTGEYDFFLVGKQMSYLSDVPGNEDSKNRQGKGSGYRASLKLLRRFDKIDLVFEPFIRYWGIESSKRSDQGYEPKNHSTEIGSKLAVNF